MRYNTVHEVQPSLWKYLIENSRDNLYFSDPTSRVIQSCLRSIFIGTLRADLLRKYDGNLIEAAVNKCNEQGYSYVNPAASAAHKEAEQYMRENLLAILESVAKKPNFLCSFDQQSQELEQDCFPAFCKDYRGNAWIAAQYIKGNSSEVSFELKTDGVKARLTDVKLPAAAKKTDRALERTSLEKVQRRIKRLGPSEKLQMLDEITGVTTRDWPLLERAAHDHSVLARILTEIFSYHSTQDLYGYTDEYLDGLLEKAKGRIGQITQFRDLIRASYPSPEDLPRVLLQEVCDRAPQILATVDSLGEKHESLRLFAEHHLTWGLDIDEALGKEKP